MSSINSIGSSAADLLAAIRQQLLAKTGAGSEAQKATASGGGLDAIISEIESSSGNTAGQSNQTSGSSGNGLSSGVLSVLIVLQEQQSPSAGAQAGPPGGGQLFAALDSNGDGQISKSELESAFTAAAGSAGVTSDQATQAADALVAKLDSNADGSVSQAELAAGAPKGHHHRHGGGAEGGGDPLAALLQPGSASTSGASASGSAGASETSSSVTNADGSTTTVTYADGTKITLSTPAAANATGASSDSTASATAAPQSPSEKLLAALIRLQEQAFQSQSTNAASLAA
jgi:EF hand domain-containing protein